MLDSQSLFRDLNYGIRFYQRLIKLEPKKNFFLLTLSCIISISDKLKSSNQKIMQTFILFSRVLCDKV